mmetsp:Transcript_42077/g.135290  ORF Transcript_42077/g.135290 Transcript_42077/m.135290 type:complete len:771 (-) Transcript_42077:33-2345(-)
MRPVRHRRRHRHRHLHRREAKSAALQRHEPLPCDGGLEKDRSRLAVAPPADDVRQLEPRPVLPPALGPQPKRAAATGGLHRKAGGARPTRRCGRRGWRKPRPGLDPRPEPVRRGWRGRGWRGRGSGGRTAGVDQLHRCLDGLEHVLRGRVARHRGRQLALRLGRAPQRLDDGVGGCAGVGAGGVQDVASVCVLAVAVGVEPELLVVGEEVEADRCRRLEVVDHGGEVARVGDAVARHVAVRRRAQPPPQTWLKREAASRLVGEHLAPPRGEGQLGRPLRARQKVRRAAAAHLQPQPHRAASHSSPHRQRHAGGAHPAPARAREARLDEIRVHHLRPPVVGAVARRRVEGLRHGLQRPLECAAGVRRPAAAGCRGIELRRLVQQVGGDRLDRVARARATERAAQVPPQLHLERAARLQRRPRCLAQVELAGRRVDEERDVFNVRRVARVGHRERRPRPMRRQRRHRAVGRHAQHAAVRRRHREGRHVLDRRAQAATHRPVRVRALDAATAERRRDGHAPRRHHRLRHGRCALGQAQPIVRDEQAVRCALPAQAHAKGRAARRHALVHSPGEELEVGSGEGDVRVSQAHGAAPRVACVVRLQLVRRGEGGALPHAPLAPQHVQRRRGAAARRVQSGSNAQRLWTNDVQGGGRVLHPRAEREGGGEDCARARSARDRAKVPPRGLRETGRHLHARAVRRGERHPRVGKHVLVGPVAHRNQRPRQPARLCGPAAQRGGASKAVARGDVGGRHCQWPQRDRRGQREHERRHRGWQ